MSFHRKSNDEIAVGIRPDQFMTYCNNASLLHKYGKEAKMLELFNRATQLQEIMPEEVSGLTTERRRVVQTVSRLSRIGSFRQQVLFAYGQRCAVTRIQLRLVDAAHILPVGAPGSVDHVKNGIALSPTYHRAFDNGLIYIGDDYRMEVNTSELGQIKKLNLTGGLEAFTAPLGKIYLPPDRHQWPSPEFVKQANKFRMHRS